MRGIVFTGNRQLELRDFPDPTPGPGEVVLEIKASGMCGSDLKFYRADGNETASLGLGGSGKTGDRRPRALRRDRGGRARRERDRRHASASA